MNKTTITLNNQELNTLLYILSIQTMAAKQATEKNSNYLNHYKDILELQLQISRQLIKQQNPN